MSQPTQTCQRCGQVEVVRMDGRGFPPDIAKRRLKKRCTSVGCPSIPQYVAGLTFGGPITGQAAQPAPHNEPAASAAAEED